MAQVTAGDVVMATPARVAAGLRIYDEMARNGLLQQLADLITRETLQTLARRSFNPAMDWTGDATVTIKPGRKYTKVDVGTGGRYMVDQDGRIFGIKAYGVIHRGHQYGTLDTIHEWHWGGYVAVRRNGR